MAFMALDWVGKWLTLQRLQLRLKPDSRNKGKRNTEGREWPIEVLRALMQHTLEEIKKQIDEIRTLCGPFKLQLTDLQEQITEMRASLRRAESTSSTNLFTIGDLDRQSLDLQERVTRIEEALEIPSGSIVAAPPARSP